jgi:putative membrane protein
MKSTWLCALTLALAPAAFAEDNAAKTTSGPTDAEIAHIVVTANQIDIDAGKLAQGKTKNSDVKSLAKTMVTDHSAVNKQAAALAKKLSLTPKENDTSKSLMSGAKENTTKLKTLKGKEFDQEYVSHEVTYHQQVLDAIDQTLIPTAKNEELKALITQVRPAIAAHLEHAKGIQSKLASAK